MKIGIEVITGFLGAGKSAFINSLIDKTIADNERIVVMLCESGNTSIKERNFTSEKVKKDTGNSFVKVVNFMDDSEKMKDKLLEIISLYKPHRIIIEYNGTETLEYLYRSIFNKELEKKCRIYTMYYICDGNTIEFYIKNMGEILLPFIQNSDVIVINNYTKIQDGQMLNRKNTNKNIKSEDISEEINKNKGEVSKYNKEKIKTEGYLHSVIKDLEELNNRAHILLAKNNEDISKALEKSDLLESKAIRNIRVKLQDTLKNNKQVRK